MDKWQIQQRINSLRWSRETYEDEISKLEAKKNRTKLEYTKKHRQAMQVSKFYTSKRTNIASIKDSINGKAATLAIAKCEETYCVGNEDTITEYIQSIRACLKNNMDRIDEEIVELKGQISSINWEISRLNKLLSETESEE